MNKDDEHLDFHRCKCPVCREKPSSRLAMRHRELNRIFSGTDERTRRLLAGFLATEYGRGGISRLACITGLSMPTIRRGQRELRQESPVEPGRVRRSGAGRKRTEVKFPGC